MVKVPIRSLYPTALFPVLAVISAVLIEGHEAYDGVLSEDATIHQVVGAAQQDRGPGDPVETVHTPLRDLSFDFHFI
jgi:hypothetical protein